jgi:hypothetical protein
MRDDGSVAEPEGNGAGPAQVAEDTAAGARDGAVAGTPDETPDGGPGGPGASGASGGPGASAGAEAGAEDDAAAAAARAGAARKARGRQTVRDMVLSMLVIGLVVGGIYLFVPHREHANPTPTITYHVELAQSRRAAPFAVAAPVGLGHGWRATSVNFGPAPQDAQSPTGGALAWHLGFESPTKDYVAIEQSDAVPGPYVADVTLGARHHGSERVAGAVWQRYDGGGSRYRALVRRTGAATTVVTGTASFRELAGFAAKLHAAGGVSPSGSPGASASASPSA